MNLLLPITLILAGTAATQPVAAPQVSFTVPAACSDVYADVYTDLDPSWVVTVRHDGKVELPMPEETDAFLMIVPGLEKAVSGMDALDRDLFYVRTHEAGFAELQHLYPNLDGKLLRAAKVQACRDAASR